MLHALRVASARVIPCSSHIRSFSPRSSLEGESLPLRPIRSRLGGPHLRGRAPQRPAERKRVAAVEVETVRSECRHLHGCRHLAQRETHGGMAAKEPANCARQTAVHRTADIAEAHPPKPACAASRVTSQAEAAATSQRRLRHGETFGRPPQVQFFSDGRYSASVPRLRLQRSGHSDLPIIAAEWRGERRPPRSLKTVDEAIVLTKPATAFLPEA